MKIEVSRMTENNAGKVAELEAKCFSDPWPHQSFINTLSNDHAAYFTLYSDGSFVGYIGMYDLVDEVSIINVAVDPDYRGRGCGELLMQTAEKFANERGCASIALEVRQSNIPARALYEKMGYVIYGCQKNYYTNPKEDAILYCKEVVL